MRNCEEAPINRAGRSRRRLRWFGIHLIIYFSAMVAIFMSSLLASAFEPWIVFPIVAWGAPLAVHAAFGMGLLDTLLGVK